MGSEYEFGHNLIRDFLFQSLMFEVDISDTNLKSDIYNSFLVILQNRLADQNDVVYLDFDIENKNNYFKVVGNNIITALWLSGVFPKNSDVVMKDNKYETQTRLYKYSSKSHKLTYTEKKK